MAFTTELRSSNMTSYTRKLYASDPAAAEAFRKAQDFDQRLTYGKAVTLACFTPSSHGLMPVYGQRVPVAVKIGCTSNCGHTACQHGCVLPARVGGSR
jgi:hypothetical protein